MKNKSLLAVLSSAILLIGCGTSALDVSTQPGDCPDGVTNAQYCMGVTIGNNSSGQNFINSTSFPISSIEMTVNGATNVLTPANDEESMDPNNCMNSTLDPGSSCTFYMKISYESFPVESREDINVTLNYDVDDNLFGDGGSGSTSFTIYENTLLYIMQNNGNLNQFGAGSFNNREQVESSDVALAVATDTNSYGFLYIGGNNGIYPLGNDDSTETSISTSPITGANNLFTSSGNLYITGNSSATGVWGYSLSNQEWLSTSAASYTFGATVNSNAHATSNTSNIYIAKNNIVYNCSNTSGNGTCVQEGTSITTFDSAQANVLSLGFINGLNSSFPGVFAGTSGGLFIETTNGLNSWSYVQKISTESITATINAITADSDGNLYAADNEGNIWLIQINNPTTAIQFTSTLPSPGANTMVIDQFGGLLYMSVLSGGSYSLYSCPIGTNITSCTPTLVSTAGQFGTNAVIGLAIGSQLND